MHDDLEKEARNRLIDAARADTTFLAERQTELPEALDRLNRQAHGDAERLRGAAEQLRRRFTGAEAIPLLEAAADHVEDSGEPEPAIHGERSDPAEPSEERTIEAAVGYADGTVGRGDMRPAAPSDGDGPPRSV